MDNLESLEEEKRIMIGENEKIKVGILNKYGVQNKLEFKRLQEDIGIRIFKKDQLEKDISRAVEKSLSVQENLKSAKEDKLNYEHQLKELLKSNNSLTIDDLKKGLEKKQIYGEIVEKIKNKKDLYRRILGNSKLDDILNKLLSFGYYSSVE